MIARIDFRQGTAAAAAILDDDGVWASDAPLVADYLNRFFGITEARVSDGLPGRLQAITAAGLLGGTASFPPDEDDEGSDEVIH